MLSSVKEVNRLFSILWITCENRCKSTLKEVEMSEEMNTELQPESADNEKRGRGRPTTYKPEYAQVARVMCSMGATDYELAKAFNVSTDTINYWSVTIADFCQALKVDKGEFDERVERSLAKRAVGYSFEEEKLHFDKFGNVTRATVVTHIPPDAGAAKMWLSARKAKEWAQAAKLEVTGKDGESLKMSDEDLAKRLALILASAPQTSENKPE
jgi:hypothetical protein